MAMSTIMLPARWLGILGTQPPRRVADRLIEAADPAADVSETERRVGTTVVHLAAGAAAGIVFGVARLLSGRRGSTVFAGLGFGAALWGVNYVIAAPALNLFPPPWDDRPGRPPVMLAAHALYGLVTATVVDRVL